MRKGFVLFLLLCALSAAGLCETAEDAFRAARPGYAIAAQDAWGDTAAAVMEGEGQRALLVAEKQDGAWRIVIDNPNALDPDAPCPSLLMDTDTALYWTVQDGSASAMFSCFRQSGAWGHVVLTMHDGRTETQLTYDGSRLRMEYMGLDENDNILSRRAGPSLPARWMKDMLTLQNFDLKKLPHGHMDDFDYPGEYALARTAEELFPGDAYLDGDADADGLRFLLRRPDGATVFAGVTEDGTGLPRRAESTPLPGNAKAYLGDENFTSALVLEWEGNRRASLVLAPYADGTWGLCQCPHFVGVQLGRNWMMEEDGHRVFGEHPWSDISALDWNSLPASEAELRAGFDPSGWATPNNPNPQDRLHLRAGANRSADSLGKYYNGTPVRVLARGDEWTQVDICGVTGCMMTRYLAFGEAAAGVAQAPDSRLTLKDDRAALHVSPREDASYEIVTRDPMVIGVLEPSWFHVWVPETDQSGYMKQDALWPGNG